MADVTVLGAYQSDFSCNLNREGRGIEDLAAEAVYGACRSAKIEPQAVEGVFVGNFVGESLNHQGLLGGVVAQAVPELLGKPSSRFEAACASGSMAVLGAMAQIEAGWIDVALVLGIEQLRVGSGGVAVRALNSAGWQSREAGLSDYLWPYVFNEVAEVYHQNWGLNPAHLRSISNKNLKNAQKNPLAHTRVKPAEAEAALKSSESHNPPVSQWLNRLDCARLSDGAAGLVLVSPRWCRNNLGGSGTASVRVKGFGHTTAGIGFEARLAAARKDNYLMPQMRQAIEAAFKTAEIADVFALDFLEVHDCFAISEYLSYDHFGLCPVGEGFRVVEEGLALPEGRLPVNPSGGLIGGGHPVGASGVRMLVDGFKQLAGLAGASQLADARRMAALNFGGAATCSACFVLERD